MYAVSWALSDSKLDEVIIAMSLRDHTSCSILRRKRKGMGCPFDTRIWTSFTNTLKLIDEEIISFTFWLIEGVNTWPSKGLIWLVFR